MRPKKGGDPRLGKKLKELLRKKKRTPEGLT